MSKRQRFYDQEPALQRMVETLLIFPEDIQVLIGAALSKIAEREYRLQELMNELRTMGVEVVLALHKSRKKQREYDKNPVVHKALSDLRIIPEDYRLMLAYRVLELMDCLKKYLHLCQTFEKTPQQEEMASISGTYIIDGIHPTQNKLDQIHQRYKAAAEESLSQTAQPQKPSSPIPASRESVRSDSLGMRIQENP